MNGFAIAVSGVAPGTAPADTGDAWTPAVERGAVGTGAAGVEPLCPWTHAVSVRNWSLLSEVPNDDPVARSRSGA